MNPPSTPNVPSSGSGSGFSPFRPGINRPGAGPQRPMRSRFPKPAPFLRSNAQSPQAPSFPHTPNNTPRIVSATPAPAAGVSFDRAPHTAPAGVGHRPPSHGGPRPASAGTGPRPPGHGGPRPGGRGGKPGRGGKRGSAPGGDQPAVRMNTFKNKPTYKTGSDEDLLSATGEQRLKIAVIGGNEEIGRNMSMIEYGNDIIIIDMGLQFPDEDMPGVDYIIPNVSYLKGKEKNIRGVIITHAHMDHIGGIPHIMPQIGNPPIFSSDLTCAIIKKRQEDFRQCPPLNLHAVKYDDVIQLGVFKIEFLGVAHSVPTSMGIIVTTPCGVVVHTGDFKLEIGDKAGSMQETEKMRKLGEKGVLALMIDSTNATQSGRQLTEDDIQHNLDEIIQNAKGKVIISTFASMIGRIQQIVFACERMGRKVAILGFSMSSNMTIAQQLGYFVAQKGTLIEPRDIHKYPREKVAIICTGAQAQEGSALIRIANHEHPIVTLEPGDSIVFSSSVIPGNERTVQRLKDTLYREGANVVHYAMMDVHAGGHARQEDLIEVHQMIKPKYLIPIEANYSMLCEHANAAVRGGFPREKILIADNGQVMEFDKTGTGMLTNKKLPTDYVFVDGLGVGNTNEIVLRDRRQLAQDGVVLVVAVIDSRTGEPQALPDIISRGFVYMKEHQELITHARNKVASILRDMDPRSRTQTNYLKDKLRDDLGQFLFVKTEQRPMIIPVIIEV